MSWAADFQKYRKKQNKLSFVSLYVSRKHEYWFHCIDSCRSPCRGDPSFCCDFLFVPKEKNEKAKQS